MSYSTGNPNAVYSRSGELLPAGATAPKNQDTQMSYATSDAPQKQQRLGVIYAVATWGLIAIAVAVTYWHP